VHELCLRFALNVRRRKSGEVYQEMQDEPSVWSEPVPVGQEGAHCLILQTSDHAAYDDVHVVSLPSRNKGRKQVVLWVVVEVQGLEKRITLQGGYQLKNYMPMPIECRFSSEEILPPEDGSRSQKDAAMARTGCRMDRVCVWMSPSLLSISIAHRRMWWESRL